MTTNVILETTMGSITLELYAQHAPRTCHNFAELARRGYYNGTIFHRVIPEFMIQGGDPTGTGRGGASIYNDDDDDDDSSSSNGTFADEIHPELRHAGAGILSMANSGPDSNGSQFFITLAPTPWLDGKHAVFGRVRAGLAVVGRMGLVPTGPDDGPLQEVRIVEAKVVVEEG